MTTSLALDLSSNLDVLHRRIRRAAERAGRDPAQIHVIGASKTVPPERLLAAFCLGVTHFGENWLQEAESKVAAVRAAGAKPTWHMIGHLQTNKVSRALDLFDVIQTVDSVHVAAAIDRRAAAPVTVLLEVNVAAEPSKAGFTPEEVPGAFNQIGRLPHLHVQGLMTVAPLVPDPEEVRPVFRRLAEIARDLGLFHLSMGMTDDFEVAIEEGATMVRVGRALFGERPSPPLTRGDEGGSP